MTTLTILRKNLFLAIVLAFLVTMPSLAAAIPTLQLDIQGGVYDTSTQTIVSSSDPFTLYALLLPDAKNTLSDTYFISAAVAPRVGPVGESLGSFTFNGTQINVTSDMTYGRPPLEQNLTAGSDPGDLASHGIYATYFKEVAFNFSAANMTAPYNTADDAGAGPSTGSGMYYMAFNIDTSLLNPDYVIHFDLYNEKVLKCSDIDVSSFAPFSHDAESGKVPEPSSLLLLGSGLLGLGFWGRKRFSA
jgi:PEP-CTERM motif-containing protein